MTKLDVSSQITFLYFEEYDKACNFFKEVLGLEVALDQKWACVFKTAEKAFIGAVNAKDGSIESKAKGGVLISLTVNNVEEKYKTLKKYNLDSLSEIKFFEDINLKSFFFKGPEGYDFEIQEFLGDNNKKIF